MKNKILKGWGEGFAKRGLKTEEIQSKAKDKGVRNIQKMAAAENIIWFGNFVYTCQQQKIILEEWIKRLVEERINMDFDQNVMEQEVAVNIFEALTVENV